MRYISDNPQYTSFYYPIIAGLVGLMVILYFFTYLLKPKNIPSLRKDQSSSNVQETLDPNRSYSENIVNSKNSLKTRYLVAYILTRASMWAKSPYIYTLFSKIHGFSMSEIGILYIVDAISALISGPILGNLADIFGRKMFCQLYCILTCLNLGMRLSGNRPLSYLAQILTGFCSGLITTNFESWVNCSANEIFKNASVNINESNKAKERFLKKLFKRYI